MALILVKVEAQTIAKTLQDVEVDALVDPHPEKLSVVVVQTIADALTRVWVVEQVKKEADTLAGVKAFPCLDTLKKLQLRELSIRRFARFDKCRPKVLLTPKAISRQKHPSTCSLTEARVMAVMLGDTMGNVEAKVLLMRLLTRQKR